MRSQQGSEGLGLGLGSWCRVCRASWAVIPGYVRLPCTAAACTARDGHASCLGLIFISSLFTSPLGTDGPVLVTGHLPLCPPRRELRSWGWPRRAAGLLGLGCGGLARRALRSTGLSEFQLTHKAQAWSCIPCTVPSLLRGGNPSGEELGVPQRCWERNNSSQQPLPAR